MRELGLSAQHALPAPETRDQEELEDRVEELEYALSP
jgi:hypothetical protein